MIIDHAQQQDIPRLTKLWQEAFGDTEEAVAHFFRTGFAPENSAVADGGAGALYWFDCLWEGNKIAYVYAVATEVTNRGRGICAKLMDWTADTLRARGYAGAILVPAEEGLARMYGKMGYRECPQAGRRGRRPLQGVAEISAGEYMALRKTLLPQGGVEHTQKAFDYMQGYLRFYRFDGGIFCGEPEQPEECLPGGEGDKAMYLPLDGRQELPEYFGLKMG